MDTPDTRCVAVFTARSPQRILREGGSQAWSLDAARVRTLPFVVCIQNQNNPDRDFSDASEAHGSAFLVGRISDVIPPPEDPTSDRWMIQISEYSTIQNPKNVWQGWRNPVKYGALEDFDIDVSKLVFHSVAEIQRDLGASPQQPTPPSADDGGQHLYPSLSPSAAWRHSMASLPRRLKSLSGGDLPQRAAVAGGPGCVHYFQLRDGAVGFVGQKESSLTM